jgi:hypothetical protein
MSKALPWEDYAFVVEDKTRSEIGIPRSCMQPHDNGPLTIR